MQDWDGKALADAMALRHKLPAFIPLGTAYPSNWPHRVRHPTPHPPRLHTPFLAPPTPVIGHKGYVTPPHTLPDFIPPSWHRLPQQPATKGTSHHPTPSPTSYPLPGTANPSSWPHRVRNPTPHPLRLHTPLLAPPTPVTGHTGYVTPPHTLPHFNVS